jgi:hypothetical protein
MRPACLLAAAALTALGFGLVAQPAAAHPYGPEDEHVNPGWRDCDDDWGSGGSPGYYADGVYYSSYPHRRHRHHRRYGPRGYAGYGQAPYGPGQGYGPQPAYGQGYPDPGYGQGGPAYGQPPAYDQGAQPGYRGPGGG